MTKNRDMLNPELETFVNAQLKHREDYKGERAAFTIRMSPRVKADLQHMADYLGVTLSGLCAEILEAQAEPLRVHLQEQLPEKEAEGFRERLIEIITEGRHEQA